MGTTSIRRARGQGRRRFKPEAVKLLDEMIRADIEAHPNGVEKPDHVPAAIRIYDDLNAQLTASGFKDAVIWDVLGRTSELGLEGIYKRKASGKPTTFHDMRQGRMFDLEPLSTVPELDAAGIPIPGKVRRVNRTRYPIDLLETHVVLPMMESRAVLDDEIRGMLWGIHLARDLGADTIDEGRILNGEDLSEPMVIPAWFGTP